MRSVQPAWRERLVVLHEGDGRIGSQASLRVGNESCVGEALVCAEGATNDVRNPGLRLEVDFSLFSLGLSSLSACDGRQRRIADSNGVPFRCGRIPPRSNLYSLIEILRAFSQHDANSFARD